MIDLRLARVEDVIADVRGASLIVADPPWQYEQDWTNGAAANHYELTSIQAIRSALAAAHTCTANSARLAMWGTWPKLGEWVEATINVDPSLWPWGLMRTGGAWLKNDGPGSGYHWRGDTEPVLLYIKGAPFNHSAVVLSNGHASPRFEHSEKPADWMRGWLRRWTRPGDLVLDLYAGRAPLAHACAAEGRDYIGAEMDPVRHGQAMEGLMSAGLVRSAPTMRQRGLFGEDK